MFTSFYENQKDLLIPFIPVAKDAFHVYLGFFVFLLSGFLLKRKYSDLLCLLPGFALSLAMEALDLRNDILSLGHPLVLHSLRDLVNANTLPLILFIVIRKAENKFRR